MSDLVLPDNRIEMEELFYPARKPTGEVKIDWNNPLTQGLYAYAMLGENIDLVDGQEVLLQNSTNNIWEVKPAEGGMAATLVENEGNAAKVLFNKPICCDKLDVSFLIRFKHNCTTNGDVNFFGGTYNTSGFRCPVASSSGNYLFKAQMYEAGGNTGANLYTSTPVNTLITVLIVYRESGIIDMYSDDGSEVHQGAAIAFVPSSRTSIFGVWNNNLQGSMNMLARFDGEMSPARARALVRSPYQILMPA